ncbi:hypothetical protein V1527DRAFT_427289 [Lipomyces starkeyi]
MLRKTLGLLIFRSIYLKNSSRATIEQVWGMTPASQYRLKHNLQKKIGHHIQLT